MNRDRDRDMDSQEDLIERILAQERRPIPHSRHPSFQSLVEFLYGELDAKRRARLSAHIATCPTCKDRLEEIRQDSEALIQKAFPELALPFDHRAKGLVERLRSLVSSLSSLMSWQSTYRLAWALAAASVLVALGIGSWSYLSGQFEQMRERLALLQQENQRVSQNLAEMEQTIEGYRESINELAQEIESSAQEVALLQDQIALLPGGGILEGASEVAVVEIQALQDAELRVVDVVKGRTLFEGAIRQGSSLILAGEVLRMSFPLTEGCNALAIKGWASTRRSEKAWLLKGEPSPIIPEAQGEICVAIFPRM